jgi:hypothetical protein
MKHVRLSAHSRRAFGSAVLLAALVVSGACRSGTDVDDEADIREITLTVGEQTIPIRGNVTTQLVLPVGTTAMSAVVLEGSDGTSLPAGDDFRLDVTIPANTAGIQFSRTGPYTGNFTTAAAMATPVNLRFSIFRLSHGHAEFGPFTVPTVVGP